VIGQKDKTVNVADKITLIINNERQYKMANQHYAIHNFCKNTDIVVEIDADDWFPHKQVLSYLNTIYSDPNIWLTYGKYELDPPQGNSEDSFIKAAEVPQEIVRKKGFRNYKWIYTGLYTYYAGLFKLIKKEDLIYNGTDAKFKGKFTPLATDASIIFPMLEMCSDGHFKFIEPVLYVLNRNRTESEAYSGRMKNLRREYANILRKMRSIYPTLYFPSWNFDTSKVESVV